MHSKFCATMIIGPIIEFLAMPLLFQKRAWTYPKVISSSILEEERVLRIGLVFGRSTMHGAALLHYATRTALTINFNGIYAKQVRANFA